ncbi:MAG: PAS domain-containing protein [Sulfuricellaceae bacterium]|nr:PAS domain-containing protein [Sulfuricellaceae bacterium]
MFDKLTLKHRLLLVLSAAGLTLLGLALLAVVGVAKSKANQMLIGDADRSLEILAIAVKEPVVAGDMATIEQILRKRAQYPDVRWLSYELDGRRLFAESAALPASRPEWFARLLDFDSATHRQEIQVGKRSYGALVLSKNALPWEDRVWTIASRLMVVFIAGLPLFWLLISWLLRTSLKTLESIRDAIHLDGGLGMSEIPVNRHTPPELAQIISELNTSRRRIGGLILSQNEIKRAIDAVALVSEADLDGTIISVNENLCQALGYSQQELLGKNHRIFKSSEHDLAFYQAIWHTITRGRVWRGEICNLSKSGEQHWLNSAIVPIMGEDGLPKRYLAIHFEITDRVRATRELAESQKLFQDLTEHLRLVYWISDPEVKQILFASPAYETVWSRSVASLMAAPHQWLDSIHPDDRNQVEQAVLELKQGREFEAIYRIVRPNGEARWIHNRAFPIMGKAGQVENVTGIAEDVTERKQIEVRQGEVQAQLQQAQKMEALGMLTGGIAHDFNNILAAILGYSSLARDRFVGENAKLKDYLTEIILAGERGRDLVIKMLAYSRGGKGTLVSIDLDELVRDTLKMLKVAIPSSIEVSEQSAADLPAVRGDPVGLQQIITNLCVNARDAMDGQGRLGLNLRRTTLSDKTECASCHHFVSGEFVELRVSDSGSGMNEAQLEKIFQPFYTTKPVDKGTGMGLAMVHGIVHEHGGHILVDSVPGEGSTFRILLPVAGENGVIG